MIIIIVIITIITTIKLSDFKEKSKLAHDVAWKKCWLKDITEHMDQKSKPNGYWTKELCAEVALKYTKKSDFLRAAVSGYHAARDKVRSIAIMFVIIIIIIKLIALIIIS